MKIYHISKLSGQDTDFRPTMLSALVAAQAYKKNNGNDVVNVYIASGFFDSVSSCRLTSKKSTNLYKALQGLDKIYLVGAYSGYSDELSLARQLKNSKQPNVNVYYKWRSHAKIFVITINEKPVFEIIGSSNMTYPAYCGKTKQNKPSPNVECDLILFDEQMINVVIEPSPQIMQFRYFSEDNNEVPLISKMNDIMSILETQIALSNDITDKI